MTVLEGSGWSPTEELVRGVVTEDRAAALHGLLDAPGEPPAEGASVPMLWHWLAFLPTVPQSQLGPDGHPRRGGFLPPLGLPRRMFGAGAVDLDAGPAHGAERGGGGPLGLGDLRVGETLVRRGSVTDVRSRTGRSGELVIVTVGYEVDGANGSISERQELVYREPPSRRPMQTARSARATRQAPGSAPTGPDHSGWEWGIDLEVGPTLLFRFSALTYNAHRIHYDRRWATEVEGYPGLVVHGPLQAVGLAELCRRSVPERRLRRFQFRSVGPAFDDGPLLLRGRPGSDQGAVVLEAFDHRGSTTMTATGTLG